MTQMNWMMPILAFGMAAAATAQANTGYSCKSHDGKTTLELYAQGSTENYVASVKNEQGETRYEALRTSSQDSHLYSKHEYSLESADAEKASLTVVRRLVVGRGGGPGQTFVTGKLVRHEVETYFSCDKAQP